MNFLSTLSPEDFFSRIYADFLPSAETCRTSFPAAFMPTFCISRNMQKHAETCRNCKTAWVAAKGIDIGNQAAQASRKRDIPGLSIRRYNPVLCECGGCSRGREAGHLITTQSCDNSSGGFCVSHLGDVAIHSYWTESFFVGYCTLLLYG